MGSSQHAVAKADEALLAELGYKQEFKRAFTPLEVSQLLLLPVVFRELTVNITAGFRYSVQYHRLTPFDRVCHSSSLASSCFTVLHSSVLYYAMPNGGPAAMVWGVCICFNNSVCQLR